MIICYDGGSVPSHALRVARRDPLVPMSDIVMPPSPHLSLLIVPPHRRRPPSWERNWDPQSRCLPCCCGERRGTRGAGALRCGRPWRSFYGTATSSARARSVDDRSCSWGSRRWWLSATARRGRKSSCCPCLGGSISAPGGDGVGMDGDRVCSLLYWPCITPSDPVWHPFLLNKAQVQKSILTRGSG